MKKFFAILLAVCLTLTLLAGCGGNTETPSDNNSGSGNGSTAIDVSAFGGVWKLGEGAVDIVKIDTASMTVTAYDANGYVISTFPVVATENGIVLKMGTVGEIELTDSTALTISAEPTATKAPNYVGKYTYIAGDLPSDTALEIGSDGKYVLSGSKADHGPYQYSNMTVSLTPTIELLYAVDYNIIGGGNVLFAIADSGNKIRIFVKSDANTDIAKAVANQCHAMAFNWKSDDGSMTIDFDEQGKVLFGGAQVGIYYPTTTGFTIEYSDGQTETVSFVNGGFALSYYGKTFVK